MQASYEPKIELFFLFRNFEELYFVAFKTSEKRDIKASMKNLMPASVDNVFPVDDNETQLEIARTMIFEKIGLWPFSWKYPKLNESLH